MFMITVHLICFPLPSTTDFLSTKLREAGFDGDIHPKLLLKYDRIREGHDYDYIQIYTISDKDIQALSPFLESCGYKYPLTDSLLRSWLCDTSYHESIIDMISITEGWWFVDKTKHLYVIDTANNIVYLRYCNYIPFPD